MKKYVVVLPIVIFAVVLLTSCSRNSTKETGYSLVDKDGNHYIVFENASLYEGNGQNMVGTVFFDSVEDFRDTVVDGKLNEYEKEIISTAFPRDGNGILSCDFNHLFVPLLPTGTSINGLYWSGRSYVYDLKFENDVRGNIAYYPEQDFNSIFSRDYEEYFARDLITVEKTEHTDENKEVTNYSTSAGEFMRIRYLISDGQKSMIVDEKYRLRIYDTSLPISATVPALITLYCTEDDMHYVVYLLYFTEKPDESWLFEFGLTLYEDNAAGDNTTEK